MGIQGLLVALKPYACQSNNNDNKHDDVALRHNNTNTATATTTSTSTHRNNSGTSSSTSNIRQFRGHNIAVDASSWFHKSVYSIADQYVENVVERQQGMGTGSAGGFGTSTTGSNNGHRKGNEYWKCVSVATDYMYKRCYELHKYAEIPTIYLVLDGQRRCPLKVGTNYDREEKRQLALEQARAYRRSRNTHAMYEKYKACIKITYEFTKDVIEQVQKKVRSASSTSSKTTGTSSNNFIEIVWSPYEADAQLVQLIKDHRATVVVTEDSDVLVYSASCRISFPIIYKLDRQNGSCDVWNMDWLLLQKQIKPVFQQPTNNPKTKPRKNGITGAGTNGSSGLLSNLLQTLQVREHNHPGLGCRLFVQACILTGCDYTPTNALQGIGFITALKLVCSTTHRPSDERISFIVKEQQQKQQKNRSNTKIRSDYEDEDDNKLLAELLIKCEAVFYYHPVCNRQNKITYLTGVPNMNVTYDDDTNSTETQNDDNERYNYQRPSLVRFPPETWSSFLGEQNNEDESNINVLEQLKKQHIQQQQQQLLLLSDRSKNTTSKSFSVRNATDGTNDDTSRIVRTELQHQQTLHKRTVLSDLANLQYSKHPTMARNVSTRVNPYSKKDKLLQSSLDSTSDHPILPPVVEKSTFDTTQYDNVNITPGNKKRNLDFLKQFSYSTENTPPFTKNNTKKCSDKNESKRETNYNKSNQKKVKPSSSSSSLLDVYNRRSGKDDVRFVKRTFFHASSIGELNHLNRNSTCTIASRNQVEFIHKNNLSNESRCIEEDLLDEDNGLATKGSYPLITNVEPNPSINIPECDNHSQDLLDCSENNDVHSQCLLVDSGSNSQNSVRKAQLGIFDTSAAPTSSFSSDLPYPERESCIMNNKSISDAWGNRLESDVSSPESISHNEDRAKINSMENHHAKKLISVNFPKSNGNNSARHPSCEGRTTSKHFPRRVTFEEPPQTTPPYDQSNNDQWESSNESLKVSMLSKKFSHGSCHGPGETSKHIAIIASNSNDIMSTPTKGMYVNEDSADSICQISSQPLNVCLETLCPTNIYDKVGAKDVSNDVVPIITAHESAVSIYSNGVQVGYNPHSLYRTCTTSVESTRTRNEQSESYCAIPRHEDPSNAEFEIVSKRVKDFPDGQDCAGGCPIGAVGLALRENQSRSHFEKEQSCCRPTGRQFKFYDSPCDADKRMTVDLTDDEDATVNEEGTQGSTLHHNLYTNAASASMQITSKPKERSCIGPAKTLRYRFGPTEVSQRNQQPSIKQAFENQKEKVGMQVHHQECSSGSSLKTKSRLTSSKRNSKLQSQQSKFRNTTLLAHFPKSATCSTNTVRDVDIN